MKCTATPEQMAERRLERLRQLDFFMRDARVPKNAREVMSMSACLSLLTGFFRNSYWRTLLWVARKTAENAWMVWSTDLWIFWHRRVMRRTDEEMDELMER